MSRFKGPRLKVMRALGVELPGLSRKSIERRAFPPGQHGSKGVRKKLSTYGVQLREKQKVRFNYGVTEKQMRRTMQKAVRKKGTAGENLLSLLESRIDNAVFRAGFAPTIPAVRQLVSHGRIYLNGRRVTIASMVIRVNDVLSLAPKVNENVHVLKSWDNPSLEVPSWIQRDKNNKTAKIVALPTSESVPFPVDASTIVEYYSRYI